MEMEVLQCIGQAESALLALLQDLRFQKREFSGCGSFTHFHSRKDNPALADRALGLDDHEIVIPALENGLGATLFCAEGKPHCLEIYSYGNEGWNGDSSVYKIEAAV